MQERKPAEKEKTVGRLLLALQRADLLWRLVSVESNEIPGYGFGPKRKEFALSQGITFCRGLDLPGLLLDFVQACRDRQWSRRFLIPGVLRSAVDIDDLETRLELLF